MDKEEIKAKLIEFHAESWGWAMHCCLFNKEEAQDVLHSAYLKIMEERAIYQRRSTFKTWLFGVIRNTAHNSFRQRMQVRKTMKHVPLLNGVGFEENAAISSDQMKWRLFFKKAIEKLSGRQREILHLVFYQDMSLHEAGEVLGISIGSARKYYDRAKKLLRRSLEEQKMGNEM